MSKKNPMVPLQFGTDKTPKTKRESTFPFVDLTDSLLPIEIETEAQAEQLRRAMVGWSNYITRLSAHALDKEMAFLVARAYLRRGVGHTALGEWDTAVSDLTQVISMNVGAAEINTACLYRARAFDGLGEDRKAVDDLTHVLAVCDQAINHKGEFLPLRSIVASLYAYRALLFCRLDSFNLAVSDGTHAIALASDCADAYSIRGSALGHLGETERALSDCTRSIELEQKAVFFYRRALVLERRGEYSQGLDFEPANNQFRVAHDNLLLHRFMEICLMSPTMGQKLTDDQEPEGGDHE